jgi:uncharacterized protein (DUF1778 family)
MIKREPRTERIDVRVTPDDKEALERAAHKYEMTVSEYMRACTLTMMLLDLDPHAFRAVKRGATEAIKEQFRKLMRRLAFS